MADRGQESFISGFKPSFQFCCEFCNEEGLHIEAVGYCSECHEHLCGSCVEYHKKLRFTRSHKILDKDTMPRDTSLASDCVRKDITTMCQQHKDEIVKYYCKTHDKLTCGECHDKDHMSCTDVTNITEINSIFNDKEYIKFIRLLKYLETKVNNISKRSRDLLAASKRCCSEAKQSVEQFRAKLKSAEINSAEMISVLDTFKTQADDMKYKDVLKLENIEKTCNTIQNIIDKMSLEFAGLQSKNRVCQAYIRLKQTEANLKEIEMQIKKAENKNTIIVFSFIPNDELLSNIEAFWKISVIGKENKNEQEPYPILNSSAVTTAVKSASFVQDINVISTSDAMPDYIITGIAVLNSGQIVLVDSNNYKIKLINNNSMLITNELKISHHPCDVTVIKEDQVAVTVTHNNTILILKVTDTITLEREIQVSGWCYGIVFSKNQLVVTYVSYVNPSYIETMDLYGNVNSKIENDKDGNKLFIYPLYVCASSDGDKLYVSDNDAHRVVSLSRDGSVKAVYTDTNLRNPTKVCLDHRGNVYICGYKSRNIHMLTPDLTKIKIILTQTDGLIRNVRSVSHCKHTDRLFVGMYDCDVAKVYQLS